MIETKFKQTEAGLIPVDWNTFTINDLFDIGNGYTPSKSNPLYWTNGSIPWFRMEDIRKNGRILSDSIQHITPIAVKNGKLFPAGSFILSTTATIGEYALLIADSLANQRFSFLTKKLNRNHIVDTNYFFHYLYKIGDWCRKNINEGGLMAVNMEDFKKYECAIPSLSEQRRIASALTAIDNLIDSLDKLISKTRDIKQGALQRLLVNDVYSQYKFLGEMCAITTGKLNVNAKDDDGEFPFFTCDAKPYRINIYAFDTSAILISGNGSHVGHINYYSGKFNAYQRTYVLSDFNKYIYDQYLLQYLKAFFRTYITKDVRKASIPFITLPMLKNFPIYVPSYVEQEQITKVLISLDNRIASLEAKRNKYEMIKKGMMQQLLTGRIRLKA